MSFGLVFSPTPGKAVEIQATAALTRILEEARRRGFLGPGDVRRHIDHALGFLPLCPDGTHEALDLGSGAGVPGLVLALAGVSRHWVFLDVNQRRAGFLSWAATELGLAHEVTVECQRAEVAGRSKRRGRLDLVVARGFGPPAVTAECASPLLHPGGVLLVAEPPAVQDEGDADGEPPAGIRPPSEGQSPAGARSRIAAGLQDQSASAGQPRTGDRLENPRTGKDRWPAEALATLGLIDDGRADQPVAIRRFRQVMPCPTRYPRRTGIPRKRPLF